MSSEPVLFWSQRGLRIDAFPTHYIVTYQGEASAFGTAKEVRDFLLKQNKFDLNDSTQPVYEWLWAMEKHFND
jgi:hypothetical protein